MENIRKMSVQDQITNLCMRASKFWRKEIDALDSASNVTIGLYSDEEVVYQAWFQVYGSNGRPIHINDITNFEISEDGNLHEALAILSDRLAELEQSSSEQLQTFEIEGKKYKIVPVD